MFINQIEEIPLIPILRKVPYENSAAIVRALVEGGVRAIEVTMETNRAEEIICEAVNLYGDQILVGAGTVLNVEDCSRAIGAGAQFIVSPALDKEVIRFAVKKKVPVIPGVFTPSEMLLAMNLGASMIKLFPASVLGPSFIKDVKGPLSHIPIMTTGGITLNTARNYLDAGAIAIGTGSALIRKDLLAAEDWDGLVEEPRTWIKKMNSAKTTI